MGSCTARRKAICIRGVDIEEALQRGGYACQLAELGLLGIALSCQSAPEMFSLRIKERE